MLLWRTMSDEQHQFGEADLSEAPPSAEVVALEYAGPRSHGIGRAGRHVVVPLTAMLPARCWKTGIDRVEAQQSGIQLIEVTRNMTWAPGWTSALALAGLVVFFPLLIVGIVFYYVYRKKLRVTFTIRRNVWRRRRLAGFSLALLALATPVAGVVAAIQTEQWWLLLPGFGGAVIAAIVAATYGRVVGVRKVVNEWAYLAGAGTAFLERETFDFAVT